MQLRPVSPTVALAPNHTIVRTAQQFEALMRLCEASPIVVFDCETSGLAWWRHARACGIALAVPLRDGWACAYVPFRHQGESAQLSVDVIGPALARLLARDDKLFIAHNLKFDEHMARCEGWTIGPRRYDTMLAAHVHDENRPISLKERAVSDLGHADARASEKILDKQIRLLMRDLKMDITEYRERYGYAQVPVSVAGPYACYDVQYTGELWQFYERGNVRSQFGRVLDVENELVGVIAGMEAVGVSIDVDYLEGIRESVRAQCKQIEAALQTQLGARYFSLGSDNALRDFMVRDLRLPLSKRTKKGDVLAVDESVLSAFAGQAPILNSVLQWRKADKLATTYTGSILAQLDSNNVLHGEFQQVGTVTGRLSCRKPNLQNFPTDDDDRAVAATGLKLKEGGKDPWSIRRAFRVESGLVRIFLDYSQIELRVLAYYSRDPLLVRAYLEGEDVHTRTSLEVFGTDAPEKRRMAKMVNFGLCVGEGQLVLTDAGLVPIERVTRTHLVWDGLDWVAHDGVVCRGVESVILVDGVWLTPDHEVYLQNGWRSKAWQVARQVHTGSLAVGESQGLPCRYASFGDQGVIGRKTFVWQDADVSVCDAELFGLWSAALCAGRQHFIGSQSKVPQVWEVCRLAGAYVRCTLRRYGAALRARYARFVASVQREGHTGEICFPGAFCALGVGGVPGFRFPQALFRSYRQRWGLRAEQFAFGGLLDQPTQSVKMRVYDIVNAGPRHRFTVSGKVVSNSYGMTEVGFSNRAHISRQEASAYLRRFFERYAGVAKFKEQLNDYVRTQNGFFQNIFGRPRRVTGIGAAENWVRGRAERQVISTIIQGTAAELTKISLVRLAKWIRDEKLPVTLRQTVHDEIQMDMPCESLAYVAPRAKWLMEGFAELQPIPVVVDGEYSVTNWADKQPLPL